MSVTLKSAHDWLDMTNMGWYRVRDWALGYGWKPEKSRFEDLVDGDGNVGGECFVVDEIDAETLADTLQRILDNLPEDKADKKTPPKGWSVDDPEWHEPCEKCGNLRPTWPTRSEVDHLGEVIAFCRHGEFSVW